MSKKGSNGLQCGWRVLSTSCGHQEGARNQRGKHGNDITGSWATSWITVTVPRDGQAGYALGAQLLLQAWGGSVLRGAIYMDGFTVGQQVPECTLDLKGHIKQHDGDRGP